MTIMVTGGAGYIGGHMVLGLLDRGETPVVVDNMSNGVPWAPIGDIPAYHADVGDYEAMSRIIRVHQVDTIIHFAALLITPEFYDKPLEFYLQNTVKSRALIQAAVDNGVKRFVFSGTAAVYGNPEVNPVSEEGKVAPISAYGMSKWVTERMLADAAGVSGMEWVVLRYFNVAGADPQGRYGQSTTKTTLLVQIAVQSALGIRNGIDVFGTDYPTVDGTCVRDYIHVTDLVDAHHAALRHLGEGRGNLLCNVGYGRGFSVKQVIETTQRVSGRDFPVRVADRRRGDAVEVVADARRAREQLGWTPRYDDLDTIVGHALRWEETMRDRYRFGAATA
jgi:UDP-glucose 4-epimerase